jgi:hypothetical protein
MAYGGNPMGAFQVGFSIGSQPGMNPLGDAIKGVMERYQNIQAMKDKIALEGELTKVKTMTEFGIMKELLGQTGETKAIPKGFKIGGVEFEIPPTPEQEEKELRKEQEQTRTKKLAEIEAYMIPARNMIGQLKTSYSKALSTAPEKGLERFRYGAEKSLETFAQTNPEVASYLQTREAFLSMIVRGLGERGMLTNTDIQRINKALPSQWTTKSVAEQNFKALEGILNSVFQRYSEKSRNMEDIRDIMTLGIENIPEFLSEEEAEQANLPSGTRIKIKGREAIWE